MFQTDTLKNGLKLITIPLPHLDSVTTLVAVGAGSRYETKKISGISHFLEHMFFKGSRKYPTAEEISTLVDGMGAVNNAATSKEYTYYYIKSSSKNIVVATDVIASMLKESIFAEEEIEREKGVIFEEMKMNRDDPSRYIWDLYEYLQFGDQPLGWDTIGNEKSLKTVTRKSLIDYVDSLYSPQNMALIYAGKIPNNIKEIAEKSFKDLPKRDSYKFIPKKKVKQTKPKINICFKKIDQTNLVLGVEGYDRYDPKKYIARVLGTILGEGMSSRLFIQVRERRGLAYHVSAGHESFIDTGMFVVYAGLRLDKTIEGLEVIIAELKRLTLEKVTEEELIKAKEMIRGRLALRTESTNFLAEHFGIKYILDKELETFEEYLKKIDKVTSEDIRQVAKELFSQERYNLQIVGPFKDQDQFEKVLKS